ncbi:MAG: rhamnose:proton symporter [Phycisphaerae bacterium]|nr:rhamnose:proton symporter [Phycisphaerae bacterium]
MTISANPMLGIGFHSVGAMLAANCYAPQKLIRRWSWEIFWIVQASWCWLLWPIIGAVLTIPDLPNVLADAVRECPLALVWSFLFSMAYGVGGIAFNLSIRYIGFSLTYAVAVGLSAVLGTVVPPLVRGQFGAILSKTGSGWVLFGVAIGALGIAVCGIAGRLKEHDLAAQASGMGQFSLFKGFGLSLLAGILSAVYGFALDVAAPVAEIAESYGAGHWKGNVIYLTANTGAFVTSMIYCLFLARKNASFRDFFRLKEGAESSSLWGNYILAILTGTLWYGQFFFYNLGHVRMGQYAFTSWAIHMIMLVLFSNLTGILFHEWKACSFRTRLAIVAGLAVLIVSVLLLTYGNYLGQQATY